MHVYVTINVYYHTVNKTQRWLRFNKDMLNMLNKNQTSIVTTSFLAFSWKWHFLSVPVAYLGVAVFFCLVYNAISMFPVKGHLFGFLELCPFEDGKMKLFSQLQVINIDHQSHTKDYQILEAQSYMTNINHTWIRWKVRWFN